MLARMFSSGIISRKDEKVRRLSSTRKQPAGRLYEYLHPSGSSRYGRLAIFNSDSAQIGLGGPIRLSFFPAPIA
jgi:hypothetical protein